MVEKKITLLMSIQKKKAEKKKKKSIMYPNVMTEARSIQSVYFIIYVCK